VQVENLKFASLIDVEELVSYAKIRQNSDGGYSFLRSIYGVEFPSSISETYYALAILSMLQEGILRKEKTVEFIRSMQRDDGTFNSPEVAFYTIRSLQLLGEGLPSTSFAEQFYSLLRQRRMMYEGDGLSYFSSDYDATSSPFRSIYCAVRALRLSGLRVDERDVDWLADHEEDGGFGIRRPDITSTYYALGALLGAGYQREKFSRTAQFIETCALNEGGYSSIPHSAPAFVESTYFAVATLGLIGKKTKETRKHIKFLCKLQNGNGGFRRALAGGISTLQNSYFAAKSLTILSGDFNRGESPVSALDIQYRNDVSILRLQLR